MKNLRGFTDANNASPACSGAHRKPFSMGKKPSNTRGIITLKSRWKTCSNKRKRIKDDPRDSSANAFSKFFSLTFEKNMVKGIHYRGSKRMMQFRNFFFFYFYF